ncbi:arylamine N-acetyltransferase family protein, partial [Gandjariella thermophila]|uniref:arylamine N-acetyltransferase family protein n=1 Tax=Gandjariella thermophila TaxID=1931992 RepID=UPI0010F6CD08
MFVTDYAKRIGFTSPFEASLDSLRRLHEAHFYTVPFENFSMHANADRGLTQDVLREAIVERRRGGICYETGGLMQAFLDACGFDYEMRLCSVLGTHRTPATHQIFLVTLDGERWLLDIGYGAQGPRGVLKLADGAELAHPALSARITLDDTAQSPRWAVSVMEHAVGATEWKPIYSFVDAPIGAIDLEMAHFYTTRFPASPLNKYKVASIPTSAGRVSVRDNTLTIVEDGQIHAVMIEDVGQ